jgi:hypothetical protein
MMAASLSTDPDAGLPTSRNAKTLVDLPPGLDPKRLRWWIFCCIAFVVIAPSVSTIIGLKIHAGQLSYDGTMRDDFTGRIVCILTLFAESNLG